VRSHAAMAVRVTARVTRERVENMLAMRKWDATV
jgi:hypothetical protein